MGAKAGRQNRSVFAVTQRKCPTTSYVQLWSWRGMMKNTSWYPRISRSLQCRKMRCSCILRTLKQYSKLRNKICNSSMVLFDIETYKIIFELRINYCWEMFSGVQLVNWLLNKNPDLIQLPPSWVKTWLAW